MLGIFPKAGRVDEQEKGSGEEKEAVGEDFGEVARRTSCGIKHSEVFVLIFAL